MLSELTRPSEGFPTFLTFIGAASAGCAHVNIKVGRVPETFSTFLTFVGFFCIASLHQHSKAARVKAIHPTAFQFMEFVSTVHSPDGLKV